MVELLPEPPDAHIDGAIHALAGRRSAAELQQMLAREHAIGIGHEGSQHFELSRREFDGVAGGIDDPVAGEVNLEAGHMHL